MHGMEPDLDAVARNRAVNPRRTPEREPLGNHLMPWLYLATAAAIVVASVALVFLLTG